MPLKAQMERKASVTQPPWCNSKGIHGDSAALSDKEDH